MALNTMVTKIYFLNPQARLPVRLRNGDVTWVTWGNRKKEANRDFPNDGWARLNPVYASKWGPWHPKPIMIAADQFMEQSR